MFLLKIGTKRPKKKALHFLSRTIYGRMETRFIENQILNTC